MVTQNIENRLSLLLGLTNVHAFFWDRLYSPHNKTKWTAQKEKITDATKQSMLNSSLGTCSGTIKVRVKLRNLADLDFDPDPKWGITPKIETLYNLSCLLDTKKPKIFAAPLIS